LALKITREISAEHALQRMMSSSLSFCRELVKIFYIFLRKPAHVVTQAR